MACYSPLRGWRSKERHPQTGKRRLVFNMNDGLLDQPMSVPCGQCIGCRLERSRQWAVRCYHEAALHEDNCFITLTYDDRNLPYDHSVDLGEFQRFMKRLRKKYEHRIRFFHCGEYGETTGRPHYHALLFGHDFTDKVLFQEKGGYKTYVSAELQSLWKKGFSTVGALSFESAAYCARYVMKKQTGKYAGEHYTWVDDYGQIHERKPEYCSMSGKPGIASVWYTRYKDEVFPDDFVVIKGKKVPVPCYYTNKLEKENVFEHEKVKAARRRKAKENPDYGWSERLEVKRKCTEARVSRLKREVE